MLPIDENSVHTHGGESIVTRKWSIIAAIAYGIFFLLGLFLIPSTFHSNSGFSCTDNGKPVVDVFPGPPWRTTQTSSTRLLLSDSRMRIELHDVLGEDGHLYRDWIGMDVVDQVNVLPYILPDHVPEGENRYRNGRFRVFRQKKYGLSEESLAVCGGQIEMKKNETPEGAAKRELEEEMSLVAATPSSSATAEWISLGTYRVNVNRGHGMISCFLLIGAVSNAISTTPEAEFHIDELERQNSVDLTLEELEHALRTHQFREIKWQATIALGLDEIKRRIQEEDQRMGLVANTKQEVRVTKAKAKQGKKSTVKR